jgi:hypothetical protein
VQHLQHLLGVVFDKLEALQKQVDDLAVATPSERAFTAPAPAPAPTAPATPALTASDMDERIGKALIEVRKDRVVFEATLTKQMESLVDKLVNDRVAAAVVTVPIAPDDLSDISIEAAAASAPPQSTKRGRKPAAAASKAE